LLAAASKHEASSAAPALEPNSQGSGGGYRLLSRYIA